MIRACRVEGSPQRAPERPLPLFLCLGLVACDGDAGTGTSSGTGAGGEAISSAQATSTGVTGTGAGPTCSSPADCPSSPNACQMATCAMGACGFEPLPAGVALPTQVSGDCQRIECDGAGSPVSVTDDGDVPDDGDACTQDLCVNGIPSNPTEPAGTPCGINLACDANGACAGCTSAAQCPGVDDDCQQRTCVAGACGFDFTLAGVPVTAQVDADCLVVVCDGAGGTFAEPDALDWPSDDGNACTAEVCNAGQPEHPPFPAGTPCAVGDGDGARDMCGLHAHGAAVRGLSAYRVRCERGLRERSRRQRRSHRRKRVHRRRLHEGATVQPVTCSRDAVRHRPRVRRRRNVRGLHHAGAVFGGE